MVIFGVAILAFCMLVGTLIGQLLGVVLGLDVNVGGIGIAMFILVVLVDYLKRKKKLDINSEKGLSFWGAMYIPIVVAMAAHENVAGAIKSGPMAILAGVAAVVVSFALVPLLSKIGKDNVEVFDDEKEKGFEEALETHD